MQRTVVIPYSHFGTTYWSHLQGSRNPRRKPWRNQECRVGYGNTTIPSTSHSHNIMHHYPSQYYLSRPSWASIFTKIISFIRYLSHSEEFFHFSDFHNIFMTRNVLQSTPNLNDYILLVIYDCLFHIQTHLVLQDFSLRDFALTWLENLHHFLNLRNNFWLNVICHRQSVTALVLCWRLAENNVAVMPPVKCTNWLHWW